MVKINEFHDMDIPKEIYPKPDYDVKEDLKIYMRNDPMFYRKAFFPAFDQYRKDKNTKTLEKMVNNGGSCKKFELSLSKELLTREDIVTVVNELTHDEFEEMNEGVMDLVKGFGNRIMHGKKDPFKDYIRYAQKRQITKQTNSCFIDEKRIRKQQI